jgi:hypothetical protein
VLSGTRSAWLGKLFNGELNKFQLRTAPELLELFKHVPNLVKRLSITILAMKALVVAMVGVLNNHLEPSKNIQIANFLLKWSHDA